MSIYRKYYLHDTEKTVVDVFGYDEEKEQFHYIVKQGFWYYKVRKAKKQYKAPDKRNEWLFPYGTYIYVILPGGKKHRLFLN